MARTNSVRVIKASALRNGRLCYMGTCKPVLFSDPEASFRILVRLYGRDFANQMRALLEAMDLMREYMREVGDQMFSAIEQSSIFARRHGTMSRSIVLD